MIRTISTVLSLLFAIAAAPATAAPPYDGIYRLGNSNEFLSVHEKDGTILVAYFYTNPQAQGPAWTLGNGQQYTAARLDTWDLLSGQLNGTTVVLSGETSFGACVGEFEVNFTYSTLKINQLTQTAVGRERNVDCFAVYDGLLNIRGGPVSALQKLY